MATRLVTFSVATLDAEARSVGALCDMLGVTQPVDWPPPYGDAGVRNWFRRQLIADPAAAAWLGHYIVSGIEGHEVLVGTAGFKGPPDISGTVEIGYSVVPAYHRRGIGKAVVDSLVAQALAHAQVQRVTAETPTVSFASQGLLEKCGFRRVGLRVDPEDCELALYEIARN